MAKLKLQKVLYKILQFIVCLLPLAVYLFIFREKFFMGEQVTKNGWSCIVYVSFIVVFIAMKDSIGDLLKHNALLKISIVMGAMFYFFRSIADDMFWICLMTAIGGALGMIPEHLAVEADKNTEAKRNAEAIATALNENKLSGRV